MLIKTANGQVELTQKEAEALGLAAAHHTSKQIGRLLDISPRTVDQRLDAARKKLGTATRVDAIRLFVASAPTPQQIPCDPLHLSQTHDPAAVSVPKEDQLVFRDADHSVQTFVDRAPWETWNERFVLEVRPKHLGWRARLAIIVSLAAFIMVLVLAGLGVANALDVLLRP